MLLVNNFVDTLVVVYIYMFIYNISFFLIFWTLQNSAISTVKTLYSFKEVKLSFFSLSVFLIVFFSIAGVPPFIGFFSKLLILISLLNSNFALFYVFFFPLLFFGLYFYLQNLKYLLSNTSEKAPSSLGTLRFNIFYAPIVILVLVFLIFGIFLFDDLTLWFYWIFV